MIRAMLAVFPLGACFAPPCAAAEPLNDAADDVPILVVHPEKSRAYVGEAVKVTVTLWADPATIRNIQYPRLGGEGFRGPDFGPPRQTSVTRNGQEYAAYEFVTILYPRQTGEIDLGPAELRYDLLSPAGGADAFFGGREPRSVVARSEPVRFTVRPLPTRGRPPDFTGAIGRFAISRSVAPTVFQSGEPITVTTRIQGVGNLDSLSCPSISLVAVQSYPPSAQRTGSRLSCEQVLVPEATVTGIEIPGASISFFDTRREHYQTVGTKPISFAVAAAAKPAGITSLPPIRDLPLDQSESSVAARPVLYMAGVLALLLVVAIIPAIRRKRARGSQPAAAALAAGPLLGIQVAEAQQALAANDAAGFYTAVFRALQTHLGARHSLHAAAITGDVVSKVLRPAGVDAGKMAAYTELFSTCDRARYGRLRGVENGKMTEMLCLLREVIDDSSPVA